MATPQRILITGANRGIGLLLTEHLLSSYPSSFIFLGSRSREKGEEARKGLPGGGEGRVEVVDIDVGSGESVEKAAKEVEKRFPEEKYPLYGIVNNAGVSNNSLEMSVNINVFGINRTTTAFAPLLDPERGRVVNVTSGVAPMFVSTCSPNMQQFFTNQTPTPISLAALTTFIDQEILPLSQKKEAKNLFANKGLGQPPKEVQNENEEDDILMIPYGLSKALANLLTLELSLRFPKLTINACTPGLVYTDMSKDRINSSEKTHEELNVVPRDQCTRSCLLLLFGEVERGGFYRSNGEKCPMDRY